jgi:hypothetical protein
MALTSVGFFLSVQLVDGGDNTSVLRYEMTAADYTTAVTDTAVILAALQAITDAVVRKYSINHVFGEAAFSFPAATVQVENKASITVLLEGNDNKKANLKIPAPVIGIFTNPTGGGSNVVDLSDADLVTYFTMFQTGNECLISDGEVADSMVSGKRIHAKSNFG